MRIIGVVPCSNDGTDANMYSNSLEREIALCTSNRSRIESNYNPC